MFNRHSGPRLPFKAALKAYWPWLLPLVLCSAVIFFVPDSTAHLPLVALLFLVSAVCAGWPWLRYDAPSTFWFFATGLWLSTGLIFPLVAGLLAHTPEQEVVSFDVRVLPDGKQCVVQSKSMPCTAAGLYLRDTLHIAATNTIWVSIEGTERSDERGRQIAEVIRRAGYDRIGRVGFLSE